MVVGGRELIDTLWNVNRFTVDKKLSGLSELIDTLWNVNVKKLGRIARGASELIDTLWNVNDCPQEFYRNFHTSN